MNNISIIVPLYKGNQYIGEILEMVNNNVLLLPQEVEVELLFINDYPIQPITYTEMDLLPSNLKIKFIENEKNLGIHGSRVKGIQNASGQYILFLDQDDKIYNNYLLSQRNAIGDADVIACNGIKRNRLIYQDRNLQERLLQLNGWLHGSNAIDSPGQALIKKTAIPDIWLKNIMKINGSDDVFLWVSLHHENAKFKINEDILFEHNWHGNNTSANIGSMTQSLIELNGIIGNLEIVPEAREAVNCLLSRHIELISNPHITNILVLHRWLYFSERGIRVKDLLLCRSYRNIAIYGMGALGECLYHSLADSLDIKIVYGIDKRAECFRYHFPIYLPEDNLPEVDVIIVTIPRDYKEIKDNLKQKVSYSILSIEDIFV